VNGRLSQYPFTAVHPKNFSRGRQGYKPVWFCVHCTDTSYAHNYPANLGAYWKRSPVQVSVHFAVSDTQTYQFVDMNDTAFQARNPTNLRAVGVEIVGKAAWSRNEWLAHKPMLRRAAKLCAEVTLACGFKTDPALLSVQALKARNSGLTCHRDVTNAFQGTHTDPGSNFPWDFFLLELRNALGPVKNEQKRLAASTPTVTTASTKASTGSDALMAVTDAEWKALVGKVERLNKQADRLEDTVSGAGNIWPQTNLKRKLDELHTKLDKLLALAGGNQTG